MNQGKKQKLMDAAIALVAETGLENFSMAKAAAKAGTSERLVYSHFHTKEAYLSACFAEVNREIAALFTSKRMPDWEKADSTMAYLHALWDLYFGFLISGGERTLFYFEYRNSDHIRPEQKEDYACFDKAIQGVLNVDSLYRLDKKVDMRCLWTYLLDAAGLFARRIIKGEWKDTEALRRSIWTLFSGGLRELLS